jgi:hypothetical protein
MAELEARFNLLPEEMVVGSSSVSNTSVHGGVINAVGSSSVSNTSTRRGGRGGSSQLGERSRPRTDAPIRSGVREDFHATSRGRVADRAQQIHSPSLPAGGSTGKRTREDEGDENNDKRRGR